MEKNADFKTLHRVLAALSFLIVFVFLAKSVQPSVPFWDCGERLTMMTWQEVAHPPGNPMFAIIGKTVQTLIPFGNLGWRGNMTSVIASSATVAVLYLLGVLVINNLRRKPIESLADALAVYGSAFVGAVSLGFSSTFWFNALEAETYSTAVCSITLVCYLMMRWTQIADEEGNERYILLSLYIMGIAKGVHLEAMLSLFAIVLIVYFRKYTVTWKSFIVMMVAGILAYVLYIDIIMGGLPAYLAGQSAKRNEAMEFAIQNSPTLTAFTIICIIAVCVWFARSYKQNKPVQALFSLSIILVLFSFTCYTQVLMRANSDTPMNQNSPTTMEVLSSYIRRDQYGAAPTWPRRYQLEERFINSYRKQDERGSYIYGEWNEPGRKIVSRSDGTQVYAQDWNNVNTAGELSFMWKYQIYQMYLRYFLWNFVGKMSDVQDEDVAWFATPNAEESNYKTGNFGVYPIRYFALPLLFGLIGFYFQSKRDPKYAFTFFAMFLATGIVLALFQNQQEPQPREREYFYVASFMVWALWIGVGTYALIDWIGKHKSTGMVAALLIVSMLVVPVNMAWSTVPVQSRAGKYLTFDYAYNVLQSTQQDAILFTNGDNDTFPVWYMQDVEGVRRDVRIVNLSLGNTPWYIEQLKNNQPWGSKKVPMSVADDQLTPQSEYDGTGFTYEWSPAKTDVIPVSADILAKLGAPTEIVNQGQVTITFVGQNPQENPETKEMVYFFSVADKLVREIVVANKFERPVYFVNSAGNDAMCGLSQHLRLEGLVGRIYPTVQTTNPNVQAYDEEIMNKILLEVDNSDNISKTPKYGLKLRNLNKSSVTYDETDRRTVWFTYSPVYLGYAAYLADIKKDFAAAQKVMDTYLKYIPLEKFPLQMDNEYGIASVYNACGLEEQTKKYANLAIKSAEEMISNTRLGGYYVQMEAIGRYYGPHQKASDLYKMVGDFDKAKVKLEQLVATIQPYIDQARQRNNQDEFTQFSYNQAMLRLNAELVAVDRLESENKLDEAFAELQRIETATMSDTANFFAQYLMGNIAARRGALQANAGQLDTSRIEREE